jgi:hypothetical protein
MKGENFKLITMAEQYDIEQGQQWLTYKIIAISSSATFDYQNNEYR